MVVGTLGKLDIHLPKNEARPFILHESQLQVDERPWCQTWKSETPKESMNKTLWVTGIGETFWKESQRRAVVREASVDIKDPSTN